jgi:ABC-type nickel/cobalt efflux system permease component RcnA
MVPLFAAAVVHQAFGVGLVLTAFGFGFRHGIDWDHIAALTDITSSQDTPRTSIWYATLYALGHAAVVFVLGFAAIMLAARLPAGVDRVTERFVGATLILLALYVFYSVGRHRGDFRMRSRWMLLITGARRAMTWSARKRRNEVVEIAHEHPHPRADVHDLPDSRLITHGLEHEHVLGGAEHPPNTATLDASSVHRHPHRHLLTMPDDPFANYSARTAFAIGMVHGIGAETPTQVLIFLTAAGVGGKGTGLLLLVCFLVGLLTANTAVAAAGTAGFVGARRDFRIYRAVALTTACISGAIGVVFLTGSSATLPALLGG